MERQEWGGAGEGRGGRGGRVRREGVGKGWEDGVSVCQCEGPE